MKNKFSERPWTAFGQSALKPGWRAAAVLTVLLLAVAGLKAMPILDTISGGPSLLNPSFFGYVDGDTANLAEFHTPYGIALDSSGGFLYIADRDNDAVRWLDLAGNLTTTFTTTLISKPVGVALDGAGNVYVLNRGNGSNGTVLEFDPFGDWVATLATGLVNAAAMAMDPSTNIYVTVNGNTLIQISSAGVVTTVATVTNAGAVLQGIVVTDSGYVAACDSGRHGILLINPSSGAITNLTGFNGAGDRFGTKANAKFNQPLGLTKAGGGLLVVADTGNHRVKVVNSIGTVTNLYGVSSNYWLQGSANQGIYPGWWNGTVCSVDQVGCPEGRQPVGVAFASDGTIFTTETYYHLIRKTTSTGLPPPPPRPQAVADPRIGWVDFTVPPATVVSILRSGSSFVFNNDVMVAIDGVEGAETHYTYGPTPVGVDTIPNPSPTVGSTPPPYRDGLFAAQLPPSIVAVQPDVTIKAINFQAGRPNGAIISTRFQFRTASPAITGNNAALFTVSDQTFGAQMWYTIDGTDPTNRPPSLGPISNPATLSLNISSNTNFKIRAFRNNYQPSEVVFQTFSATNFDANKITFGFAAGEASSDFIASPGQYFYSPVTLSILPGTKIYSLQFNLTVTNTGPGPAVALAPGAVNFKSFLEKPDPGNPGVFITIPPYSFAANFTNPPPADKLHLYNGTNYFVDMTFVDTNSNFNLLGVGWLERFNRTNLYDTGAQDLIKYSQPHDTLFNEANGRVVLGGYAFRIPGSATAGQTYQIQIGLPSATSDGVGVPGSDVYISAPTNGSLAAGAVNSVKIVTAGQRKYIVGDVAPFRWFNAGDFGDTKLVNSDVMQVFQSAIYNFNNPPAGSDFEDAMNSCCGLYVDNGNGYLEQSFVDATANPLFDGNDSMINLIAFGDTKPSGEANLDVTDIYVTFRRSLDPSLKWFQRFWTNGVRAAQTFPNPNISPAPLPPPPPQAVTPEIKFTAGDGVAAAGQTIFVPINAPINGNYPLRVLGLGITVEPLDGSPAITTPVQFSPNAALGSPTIVSSRGAANYSAAWLNSSIAGLSGDALLGTLQVTLPANCTSNAAYAIHFDHASGSPNGLASFPRQTRTGLITPRDRSASSFNDGIPDSWRLRYFGTLDNLLSQADADADGDGATNLQESKAGTDPNDPNSVLRLKSKAGQPHTCVVRWPSVTGKQYVIERASSIYAPAWTSVSTNNGTGWEMEYQDSNPGAGSRFYRVRLAQ